MYQACMYVCTTIAKLQDSKIKIQPLSGTNLHSVVVLSDDVPS